MDPVLCMCALSINNTCVLLLLAFIQLTELCIHMAAITGGFRDTVSSRRVDTVSLLAPMFGDPCSTGVQLLRCIQTTGQQMGTETTDKHRIITNISPLHYRNSM